ncbi:MAG: hypothetical protein QNJ45_00280 [Ardenticatenaceae bacterium]|nr:hypothetical protein [Ardenticatenaceae bacterium]
MEDISNSPVDLFIRLGCLQKTAQTLAYRLFEAYQGNLLPYHNLTHIEQTISFAQRWAHLVEHIDLVFLALWFHDIVYDPQKTDNEERSAQLLIEWLRPTPIDADMLKQAAALIMATKHHHPQNAAEGLTVDADLAILGMPADHYRLYAQAIRQEYSWVPDSAYQIGRRDVLKRFLDRSRLYFHDPIATQLETTARKNLLWELTHLEQLSQPGRY